MSDASRPTTLLERQETIFRRDELSELLGLLKTHQSLIDGAAKLACDRGGVTAPAISARMITLVTKMRDALPVDDT